MKSVFFTTILIAVAIINNVSAIEYIDAPIYDQYQEKCTAAGWEKCNSAERCAQGTAYTQWGSFPACLVDQSKYRRH